MVTVTVARGTRGIDGITVEGHAGYRARGKDIVCAAASTLAYAAAGALEEIAGLAGCHEHSGGFFSITVPLGIDDDARRVADTVLRTACVGYRQIAASYPKRLRVRYAMESISNGGD